MFSFKKAKDDSEQQENKIERNGADYKISKTKRDKLLMPENKIPSGFIDRELRDTQYIAKKARELIEAPATKPCADNSEAVINN